MNENKKGLHFIVGIAGLWLLWWLYSHGVLHYIGFLSFEVAGYHLPYTFGGDTYTTPLATFASLIIDTITVLGYLIIIASSGIWDFLMVASKYLQDLFSKLREYLKVYVQKNKEEAVLPKETEKNILEVILESIKDIQEKQDKLELKIKDKEQVNE